ncbi:hypothetical protein BJV78DRAFT_1168059 [Lactifluus subvellereus]|nr:hypothetical protein BJV78DRAFT_1168059 [Lactifluus subvellereus]
MAYLQERFCCVGRNRKKMTICVVVTDEGKTGGDRAPVTRCFETAILASAASRIDSSTPLKSVLNERVVLLGRWRHGFFDMVPVSAMNIGSIKVKFDQPLCTNVHGCPLPPGMYPVAVYSAASLILNSQPLRPVVVCRAQ